MSRADVERALTMGDAVARVVRSRERFPLASSSEETAGMVAEGERVIARARRVRSWYRSRVYTVGAEIDVDGLPVVLVGRGSTLLDALANLGAWEAW